jgi:hypothetical protein
VAKLHAKEKEIEWLRLGLVEHATKDQIDRLLRVPKRYKTLPYVIPGQNPQNTKKVPVSALDNTDRLGIKGNFDIIYRNKNALLDIEKRGTGAFSQDDFIYWFRTLWDRLGTDNFAARSDLNLSKCCYNSQIFDNLENFEKWLRKGDAMHPMVGTNGPEARAIRSLIYESIQLLKNCEECADPVEMRQPKISKPSGQPKDAKKASQDSKIFQFASKANWIDIKNNEQKLLELDRIGDIDNLDQENLIIWYRTLWAGRSQRSFTNGAKINTREQHHIFWICNTCQQIFQSGLKKKGRAKMMQIPMLSAISLELPSTSSSIQKKSSRPSPVIWHQTQLP